MTWVKICGITNLEDAKVAVHAGADALGFVFYEKSGRNVAPETVRAIAQQLPAAVERLGVFVGDVPEALRGLMHAGSLTGMQLHFSGGTSGSHANGIPPGCKVYLSMPADFFLEHQENAASFLSSLERISKNPQTLPQWDRRSFEAIFLDSITLLQPGGTGKVFDWQRAVPVVEQMKRTTNVVVAGGLTPANVADAMRILKPWGVDVSSGVEASPGKKDPEKVRAFVAAVRKADRGA